MAFFSVISSELGERKKAKPNPKQARMFLPTKLPRMKMMKT
jgi:hypothetical protein